jgi:hypothetical protein
MTPSMATSIPTFYEEEKRP